MMMGRTINRSRYMNTLTKPFQSQAWYLHLNTAHNRLVQVGAFGLAMAAGQYSLGSATNFFDEKFVVQDKSSEDLADFYGTEDFMDIFCVFPFMVDFMMRGAEFDDDGTIHAWGLLGPGELQVSILFEEREVDTNGDGEPDTLVWFNKKETFSDRAPSWLGGFMLWEMTQNFGYHRYEDGTCVVSHQGEKFEGLFLVRLLFQLHAKYVAWATEKYLNGPNFAAEDREDLMEEERHNIPLHAFKTFLSDLTSDVERAKTQVRPDSKQATELDGTLRKLNTLANDVEAGRTNLPRLRTRRSHKANVKHVQLVMDDVEGKKTIQTAVQQLEGTAGPRGIPSKRMMELSRRTTALPREP
jgi:hypothetical protein